MAWAPLVFGLYHIVRMCADETDPVPIRMCLRSMVVVVLLTILLLWALRFLVPGLARRAVIITAFYILFFNYTQLAMLVWMVPSMRRVATLGLTYPVIAFGLIAALMAAIMVVMRRSRSDFTTASNALGIFATVLLVFALYPPILPFVDGSRNRWMTAAADIIDTAATVDIRPVENLPDVYYIILDGYARADVLQTLYGYDNSDFLRFLSDQGFYTPSQSSSNYSQTYLSLASSLNLSYLDELHGAVTANSGDRRPLLYLIQNNSTAQILRRAGYRFVFFSSSYQATSENPQANICYCQQFGLNAVENTVVFQTPLTLLRPLQVWQHDMHRRKISTTLDGLAIVAGEPGPKFVFAHVLSPHPPFVFGANGQEVTPRAPFMLNDGNAFPLSHEEYLIGYVNQLASLNSKLQAVILSILAQSTTPPIIILQADHGPGSMLNINDIATTNGTERLSVFSSYLVPKDLQGDIPDAMTSVNTFRILFNAILGTDFALEEDHSYLATWRKPYNFVPVPRAAQNSLVEP